MALWADDTFVNINSGGSYSTAAEYSDTDLWKEADLVGIQESFGASSVSSVRQTAAVGPGQFVRVFLLERNGPWVLKLRCAATQTSGNPMANGNTVFCNGDLLFWYRPDGSWITYTTKPTFPTGPGTVEARMVGTVMSIIVGGATATTFDFGSDAQTGMYQGFGSNSHSIVTYADGGDITASPSVPGQVTGLTAKSIDIHQVDMSWGTQPSNGGGAILGYRISRAPDVGGTPGTYTVIQATTGSPWPRSYSDLTVNNGEKWWYRVSALNSAGEGAVSTAVMVTVVPKPPPAFYDDFSNGLKMWTIARWRSMGSQQNNPGWVPPSSGDDDHYDGVLGTHTTPTGVGLLPPYDIFVGTNNYLYVGGGSQNYGDTFLRCAQQMDLTGNGPWTIRLGMVINFNAGGLEGWSTLYLTDKPMPSPSMRGENSNGCVPQYGWAIRMDSSSVYDGTNYHPAPGAFWYDNFVETGTTEQRGFYNVPTDVASDLVIVFTRTLLKIYLNGVMWMRVYWSLNAALTKGWIYLGAHNHATKKYPPHADSRSAVYTYIGWDGPVITPQYSYPVPDSLTAGNPGDDAGDIGVNVGWNSPTGTLTIPNVPANVSSAKLLISSHWVPGFPDDGTSYFVRYSLNGNPTHDAQTDYKAGSGNFAYNFNVNPAELVTGNNTLSITLIGQTGSFPPYVGNISLLVESFNTGKVAVGSTILSTLRVGATALKSLAIGAVEIWKAPLPPQRPSFPSLITLLNGNEGELIARWSLPVDHGSALTDYVLQYRTSPSGTWTAVSHTASTTRTRTITGLTTSAPYDARVAAVNGIGQSDWSNVLTTTTNGPATVPGQVPGLTAGTPTTTTVPLHWLAAPANGNPITDYEVQFGLNSETPAWETYPHTASTALLITVDGLTEDTDYAFRVRAINGLGNGDWSDWAFATTATTPPPAGDFLRWRTFDGVDDFLRFAGAESIGTVTFADSTVAICLRRSDSSRDWECFFARQDTPGTTAVGSVYFEPGDTLDFWSGIQGASGGATLTTADGPGIAVMTKTNMSHIYKFGTDAWNHGSFGGSAPANGTPMASGAAWQISNNGDPGFSQFLAADVAVVAYWDRELTTTEIETLQHSLQAWYDLTPAHVWRMDDETVHDSVGTANLIASSGTTLTAVDSPLRSGVLVRNRGAINAPYTGGSADFEGTSDSFTPAAGALVVAMPSIQAQNNTGGTADIVFDLSDTWGDTGGTDWELAATSGRGPTNGNAWCERADIWTRIIGTGATPGAVTATAKIGASQTSGQFALWAQLAEVPGGGTVGVVGEPSPQSNVSSFAVPFSGEPLDTSIAFSNFTQDYSTALQYTPPTGFTVLGDQFDIPTEWQQIFAAAYRIGSVQDTPTWTGLVAMNRVMACAVEILVPVPAPAIYTDDFNRADGVLTTPWVLIDGALPINGNKVVCSGGALHTVRYDMPISTDHWLEADLAGNVLNVGVCGPMVRVTESGDFYYFWMQDGSPTGIYKRVSGSYGWVANGAPLPSSSVVARMEAEGSSIRLYINDTLWIDATDGSITTGQPGILANGNGASLDNWRCGDMPYVP